MVMGLPSRAPSAGDTPLSLLDAPLSPHTPVVVSAELERKLKTGITSLLFTETLTAPCARLDTEAQSRCVINKIVGEKGIFG